VICGIILTLNKLSRFLPGSLPCGGSGGRLPGGITRTIMEFKTDQLEKIQEQMLRHLYRFADRTVRYTPKSRTFTLPVNISFARYMAERLHERGFVKSIGGGGQCAGFALDVDAHSGEDRAEALRIITERLDVLGLLYLLAASSYNADGTARGWHVYVPLDAPLPVLEVEAWLKSQAAFNQPGVDLFPARRALRLWFIDKRDGTRPGAVLNGVTDLSECLNPAAIVADRLGLLHSRVKTGGVVSIALQKSPQAASVQAATAPYWHRFCRELRASEPGMTLGQLNNHCRRHAEALGWELYPLTERMIEIYYRLKISTARMRLYRWNLQRGPLQKRRLRKGKGYASFYRTGSKAARRRAQQLVTGPRAGKRNDWILAAVRAARNAGIALSDFMAKARRLYRIDYDGATPWEVHAKHLLRAWRAWRPQELAAVWPGSGA